ncbi:MAG: hypothetical protein ACXW4I_09850 [Candidatus Deferrimicrobiaceae bacterium]
MRTKRVLALLAATVFTLGLAGPALSGHIEEEQAARLGDVQGTVTKIEGTKVTIKDSTGTEKTIEAKGPYELKDLKVGDQVAVMDGKLTREGGAGPSSPSPGPKY